MKRKPANTREIEGDFNNAEFYCLNFWKLSGAGSWPLYPFAEEEIRRSSAIVFREQSCRYLLLALLLEGELRYVCGGEEFLLKQGEILVIPPGSTYRFESKPPGFYHKRVIELKGINLLSLLETLGLDRVRLLRPGSRFGRIAARVEEIAGMIRRNDRDEIAGLMGANYALLNELSMLVRNSGRPLRLLAAAQARLESRLDEPLRIGELAAELRVSSTLLERLFRRKFGMSPKEYRIQCRIEQAKYLLIHTGESVKEIAFRVGYCNQFYFSREFSRLTGRPPRDFRSRGTLP